MNEDIPIVPLVILGLVALCMGYEVDRRRHKLKQIFFTFDREESAVASALERLVESGRLKPYEPGRGLA